ncbi:MAG: hypothetical protein AAGF94_06615 [Pseudomonadota bacterium]
MRESYQEAIQAARAELLEARKVLVAELRGYPTPVAGCDLQYTYLLSEHHKVSAALSALGETPFIPTPRTLDDGAGVESR